MAKAMSNRMQPLLPEWIQSLQTAFVKNRQILDNVFLAYEAMEWAKMSNQDLVVLMIDFEKAFDQVNWTFLKAAMAKMGFSEIWINWVAAFYEGASTSILVNGVVGEEFEMERGVRQGCPMAPYLYLFIADALAHMLKNPDNEIEGLQLPNGAILREALFADDSNLYLKGTIQNLNMVDQVLKSYCGGTGSNVNWDKSAAIWASLNPRTWQWGQEKGLRWIPEGSSVTSLGFPLGFNMGQKEKNAKVLSEIRGKLAQWVNKPLSMAARILVTNQVVLASIWYIASCADLARSVLAKARTLVRNFIWSGKIEENQELEWHGPRPSYLQH